MSGFLSFDRFITPRIIHLVFVLVLPLIAVCALALLECKRPGVQ